MEVKFGGRDGQLPWGDYLAAAACNQSGDVKRKKEGGKKKGPQKREVREVSGCRGSSAATASCKTRISGKPPTKNHPCNHLQ